MKKRLLFVDDEPRVLDGLRRMLYEKQHEWDMTFAPGGLEAIEELKKSSFDVIVSDMRMPKIDGATLLKFVHDNYPRTVRIVLSGYAEMETALRAVPIAHQFLCKPCDARHFESVVNRACNLQVLLSDTVLQNEIGKIDNLPALPKTYHRLTRALSLPETSLKDVADIVEEDMAISAKVLQLVNSAFFGLPRRVTDVRTAVTYIGMNMLKNLTLSIEVFKSFAGKKEPRGFSLDQIQRHAMLTANLAKKMFRERQKSEDAFIAGMLHDLGKLILLGYLPDKFEKIAQAVNPTNATGEWHLAEKQCFGITHAEIGAYLLGIWGLPYPIVEAVAYHHEPWKVTHGEFDILPAIYVANHLSAEDARPLEDRMDLAYLEKIGVIDRLPEWQILLENLRTNQGGEKT